MLAQARLLSAQRREPGLTGKVGRPPQDERRVTRRAGLDWTTIPRYEARTIVQSQRRSHETRRRDGAGPAEADRPLFASRTGGRVRVRLWPARRRPRDRRGCRRFVHRAGAASLRESGSRLACRGQPPGAGGEHDCPRRRSELVSGAEYSLRGVLSQRAAGPDDDASPASAWTAQLGLSLIHISEPTRRPPIA